MTIQTGREGPKILTPLAPPVSYMEERGVFQPLASTTNTFGLCCFYCADPNVPMPTGPESMATAEHVKRLLLLASTKPQLVCHHSFPRWDCYSFGFVARAAYVKRTCLNPYLPDWGSQGHGHGARMSCCPFCAYTVQNDPAYLNHIVCVHYDASFGCGGCH